MKSLKEILQEEVEYWFEVLEVTNNRLLGRVASNNIIKRRGQIVKLSKGVKITKTGE